MKRLYLEHREVEEARDRDAVVATFDEECFLENVAVGSRAEGRAEVRRSYEALFEAFPRRSRMRGGAAGLRGRRPRTPSRLVQVVTISVWWPGPVATFTSVPRLVSRSSYVATGCPSSTTAAGCEPRGRV